MLQWEGKRTKHLFSNTFLGGGGSKVLLVLGSRKVAQPPPVWERNGVYKSYHIHEFRSESEWIWILVIRIVSKYFVTIYCFTLSNARKPLIAVRKLTQQQPITHTIQVKSPTDPDIWVNNLSYHSLSLTPDCNSVHKPPSWVWKHMWLHLPHSWLCLLTFLMLHDYYARNHHQLPESAAFWLPFLLRCL